VETTKVAEKVDEVNKNKTIRMSDFKVFYTIIKLTSTLKTVEVAPYYKVFMKMELN
jgi:hypothetical protein